MKWSPVAYGYSIASAPFLEKSLLCLLNCLLPIYANQVLQRDRTSRTFRCKHRHKRDNVFEELAYVIPGAEKSTMDSLYLDTLDWLVPALVEGSSLCSVHQITCPPTGNTQRHNRNVLHQLFRYPLM